MVRSSVVSVGPCCTGTLGTLMDPFEKLLADLVDHMKAEWQSFDNWTSPLGELTAEAAAVLAFYREQRASISPQGSMRALGEQHWSTTWRRNQDG